MNVIDVYEINHLRTAERKNHMKTDPRSCERNFGTIWEKLGEIVNRKNK